MAKAMPVRLASEEHHDREIGEASARMRTGGHGGSQMPLRGVNGWSLSQADLAGDCPPGKGKSGEFANLADLELAQTK